MACYKPIQAYRTPNQAKLEFQPSPETIEALKIPCGRCIGCRLENSRQKAMRGTLEAQMHDQNSWLTLTYAPGNEPPGESVNRRDLDLFMKRLRKRYGTGISHLSCGEYGDRTGRMHYHVCLFGHDFGDKYPWQKTGVGTLYRSDALEEIWTEGHAIVGEVNFDTIAYTARYITKKITGDKAEQHYQGKEPEFLSMSRKPAVGLRFVEEYADDIYPKDFVTIRGRKMKPPVYYDRWLEKNNPNMYEEIKWRRKKHAIKHEHENWKIGRLDTKAECKKRQLRKKNDSSHIHGL